MPFCNYFEKFYHYFLLKTFLNKTDSDVYLPVQTPYLGKFLFWSYYWKGFKVIILQDSLIRYISTLDGISRFNWFFVCWQITKKEKPLIQFFSWRACPSSTWAQRLSESYSFTEHTIEWKLKWKKKKLLPYIYSSQFITVNPVVQSDCRIYWSVRHLEKIIKFLCCLCI